MLNKIAVLYFIFILNIFAVDKNIQDIGVNVAYQDENGDNQVLLVKRATSKGCTNVKFEPKYLWNNKYVEEKIADKCKVSVVTTIGKVSAIKFQGIETYGELEVLEFLKKSQEDEEFLLIDTREEKWFFHSTIASSINIPFNYFSKARYPDEFADTIETLGVSEDKKEKYDFTNAKNILLFCNGAWCGQSVLAIKYLNEIGYPKNKMFWYRGGIQSWKMLGFPLIKQ